MSPDLQQAMFAALAETLALAPDSRFGQMIAHLGDLGEDYLERNLGDLEDDELLAILYRHRAELLARAHPDQFKSPPAPGPFVSLSGSELTPPSPSAGAGKS
jgi:hypothetical protein